MANPHPNMSGLKSFNKMEPKEKFKIQQSGGIASAKVKKQQKTIKQILENMAEMNAPLALRRELKKAGIHLDKDDSMLETIVKVLCVKVISSVKVTDIMKFLDFYAKYTGQDKQEPERRFVDVPDARIPVIVKIMDDEEISQNLPYKNT